jgi:UDP-GlcNAc:undecaprenyl-phosphate/decaprenyl-phosphate GlcNAc-1-phosphate transferase
VSVLATVYAAPLLFFLTTMAITALVTPVAMRVALRVGLTDRPAPHKFHQRTTPYLGGAAVGLSVLIALVVTIVLIPERRVLAATVAVASLAVAGIGLLDDWLTIGTLPRLAVQAAAALSLWAAGIRVSATGTTLIDLPLMVFVVLAVTNAVNLLDNMDGLSAGTVAIASMFFFLAAYSSGQRLVPILAVALAGACLGFLPFNFSPARIFLGDAGTLFMGFMVATVALRLELPGYPAITRFAVPALILLVPIFDMTLVVLSRWRAGRPVFRGGTDHSSHRLVALGASPRLAALVTYAAATLSGTAALFLLQARSAGVTLVALVAAAVLTVSVLWRLEKVPAVTPAQLERAHAEWPKGARSARTPVVVSTRFVVSSGTLPPGH